ncbi:GNAT family N-acetyltransferase [soil metagenome]
MPSIDLQVRRADSSDRLPIYRMLELYQHDLSDIWDQDLDAHGEYGYALDRFWHDPDCHAFVATVDGRYAGVALVDGQVKLGQAGFWMSQFFVLKKYRRRGVGDTLATTLFDRLPGRWEVGQMPDNLPAQAFWRRVIGAYTSQGFDERAIVTGEWVGIIQSFRSRRPGGVDKGSTQP